MKRATALAAALLALLAFAPSASADKTISEPGEGAGQTQSPQGLATDFETSRLYVADQGNHRIDVFDKDGAFELAFGWGVADGKAELQSCGPKATPPTATCQKGLKGGAAGEFTTSATSRSTTTRQAPLTTTSTCSTNAHGFRPSMISGCRSSIPKANFC